MDDIRTQEKRTEKYYNLDQGSIELVVLGLLAALIVVLAIPLFAGIGEGPQNSPTAQSEQHQGSQHSH